MAHMTNVASLPAHDDERPVNQRVGFNVSTYMRLRGVSQKTLAKQLGVTQGSMSRRINGTTDWSPDDMQRAADYLGIEVSRLFERLPYLAGNEKMAPAPKSEGPKLPELDSNQQPAG